MLAGVFLSVHTPRYCTLEAAFEGKLASEVFRPVRDGLIAQGHEVAHSRLDVVVINSCHLVSTCPPVVAQPEMGGRHLAMMLGVILESRQRFVSTVHA